MHVLARHGGAAIAKEHMPRMGIVAPQASQCAQFLSGERVNTRNTVFHALKGNCARYEVDLRPFERGQFGDPETMPPADQDHGMIARDLTGLEEQFDLGWGEVLLRLFDKIDIGDAPRVLLEYSDSWGFCEGYFTK